MSENQDAKKIWDWLREPDFADDGWSLSQMIEWVSRRPIAEASRLLAPVDE